MRIIPMVTFQSLSTKQKIEHLSYFVPRHNKTSVDWVVRFVEVDVETTISVEKYKHIWVNEGGYDPPKEQQEFKQEHYEFCSENVPYIFFEDNFGYQLVEKERIKMTEDEIKRWCMRNFKYSWGKSYHSANVYEERRLDIHNLVYWDCFKVKYSLVNKSDLDSCYHRMLEKRCEDEKICSQINWLEPKR